MTRESLRERIPPGELVAPGQAPCPGSGAALALRLVLKALGPQAVVVMTAGGPAGTPELRVPVRASGPDDTVTVAAAVRAELDGREDRETVVLAWTGDAVGDGAGLADLAAAAERGADVLVVCADDEARWDGSLRAGTAVPWGTWVPAEAAPPGAGTARGLRLHPARDLVGVLAAHRVPYAATASIAHPVDLVEKVRRARATRGTRFLHVLAPCPPRWGHPGHDTVDLARAAVRSRVFPLYEVEDGRHWRVTAEHPGDPVGPYLARQERFRLLSTVQVRLVQAEVDARWEVLQRRVAHGV